MSNENYVSITFGDNDCIRCRDIFQYDKGQKFYFTEEMPSSTEVQFDDGKVSVVVDSLASIPSETIETVGMHVALVQIISEDAETVTKEIRFLVKERTKKNDYVEPEEEQTFREEIAALFETAFQAAAKAYALAETKQDQLPDGENDRYLHKNSETGEIEWKTVSVGPGGDIKWGDIDGNIELQKDLFTNFCTIVNFELHTNNQENPHNVTKEQVGLDKVDNTADINKPVSTATQALIDKLAEQIVSEATSIADLKTAIEEINLAIKMINDSVNSLTDTVNSHDETIEDHSQRISALEAVTPTESSYDEKTLVKNSEGKRCTAIGGYAYVDESTGKTVFVPFDERYLPEVVEQTTNKSTSLSAKSTNTQYPSALAVWKAIQENQITIDGKTIVKNSSGQIETVLQAYSTTTPARTLIYDSNVTDYSRSLGFGRIYGLGKSKQAMPVDELRVVPLTVSIRDILEETIYEVTVLPEWDVDTDKLLLSINSEDPLGIVDKVIINRKKTTNNSAIMILNQEKDLSEFPDILRLKVQVWFAEDFAEYHPIDNTYLDLSDFTSDSIQLSLDNELETIYGGSKKEIDPETTNVYTFTQVAATHTNMQSVVNFRYYSGSTIKELTTGLYKVKIWDQNLGTLYEEQVIGKASIDGKKSVIMFEIDAQDKKGWFSILVINATSGYTPYILLTYEGYTDTSMKLYLSVDYLEPVYEVTPIDSEFIPDYAYMMKKIENYEDRIAELESRIINY